MKKGQGISPHPSCLFLASQLLLAVLPNDLPDQRSHLMIRPLGKCLKDDRHISARQFQLHGGHLLGRLVEGQLVDKNLDFASRDGDGVVQHSAL